nr:hypothetical protein [Polynucleobacter sp. 71A-WALBACH]
MLMRLAMAILRTTKSANAQHNEILETRDENKLSALVSGLQIKKFSRQKSTVVLGVDVWIRPPCLIGGAVKKEASLGSFFDDMSQAKRQTDELTKLIAAERRQYPNMSIIMVTHHVNIQSYVGMVVNSGDMVLVKVDSAGKPLSFKVYPSP